MSVPAAYRIGHASAEDLPAVAGLLTALDGEGSRAAEAYLREEWDRPGFDPALHARLCYDAQGRVAGYAEAFPEDEGSVDSWALVHPEHTGQGLGTSLVELIENEAPRLAPLAAHLRNTIRGEDTSAAELLRARGYVPERLWWHMALELDASRGERPDPPAGVTIRGFEPGADALRFHEVVEAAFADHWGWRAETFETFQEREMTGPDYDPALWFVGESEGTVVGILLGRVWGDRRFRASPGAGYPLAA